MEGRGRAEEVPTEERREELLSGDLGGAAQEG